MTRGQRTSKQFENTDRMERRPKLLPKSKMADRRDREVRGTGGPGIPEYDRQ